MPLPIRATVDLVESQLLDESGVATLEQVRLGYSMALVRLVNGAADDGQRGEFAQSVASLAARVGLPKWLVDVRHESTHQTLPSIQVLRLASGQALAWLDEHYWTIQEEEVSHIQPRRLDEKITQIAQSLERGDVRRDIGPKLQTTKQTAVVVAAVVRKSSNAGNEEEDEEGAASAAPSIHNTTAQDIVDSIKHLDTSRLAKALFRGMAQRGDDWTKWERVIHWMDGENSLRVSRKLLMVCFREALKPEPPIHALSLIRGLLSRRFHMENRPTLAKIGTKSLSVESNDSWTKKEKAHMDGFAPDVFLPELAAAAKLCFSMPSNQSLVVLKTIIVPALMMKKKSTEERAEFTETISELFRVHWDMIIDNQRGEDESSRSIQIDEETRVLKKKHDWATLEAFCKEQERLQQFKGEKDESIPGVDHLRGDGMQEWTRVVWPGAPIGSFLRDQKKCPALVVVPPPPMDLIQYHEIDHGSNIPHRSHVGNEETIEIMDDDGEDIPESTPIVVRDIAKKIKLMM
jgi:hypothetical protein